jgi:hypothetical protein
MKQYLTSKQLHRNQNSVAQIKAVHASVGAAPHTLIVRALQLSVIGIKAPKLIYNATGERDVVYPGVSYSGAARRVAAVQMIRSVVVGLAESNSVQLSQASVTGEYFMRYTRCDLTGKMRRLNEALSEMDFDMYTTNVKLRCSGRTVRDHEAAMRLNGVPIRIARKVLATVVVAQ